MNDGVTSMSIWGMNFLIRIVFDCFEDEVITDNQRIALDYFLGRDDLIESARQSVVDYIVKKTGMESVVINRDVLGCVYPREVYITREEKPRVALLCDSISDPEHGLAVVFSEDGSIKVGSQDIIL